MNEYTTDSFEQWRLQQKDRFPPGYLDQRLAREDKKTASLTSRTRQFMGGKLNKRTLINRGLKFSGLLGKGKRNAAAIAVRHHQLSMRNLPDAFVDYRILHISDLHFNGNQQLEANLINSLESIEYDLCVLTGDFRFRSFGSKQMAMTGLGALINKLEGQTIAILGNHDSIHMVPHMETLGIRVLLNECCEITKDSQSITIAGVDDPSYYRMDDLDRALGADTDTAACSLLLAPPPEIYQQAANAGICAYLCGHTHGGQICLPGGIPIMSNTRAPRWAVSGAWSFQQMSGYTSVGAGTSIAEVRFFCPPEMTVHQLTHT